MPSTIQSTVFMTEPKPLRKADDAVSCSTTGIRAAGLGRGEGGTGVLLQACAGRRGRGGVLGDGAVRGARAQVRHDALLSRGSDVRGGQLTSQTVRTMVDGGGDPAAQQAEEDGAEDGHAEGAAELLHRGHGAGRRTRLVLLDAGEHDVEERRHEQAHPDAGDEQRRQKLPGTDARPHLVEGQPHTEHTERHDQRARLKDGPPEPGDTLGEPEADDHAARPGHHHQSRLER